SGGTTLLAMIVSSDPIRFEFTFDEASYLRYERMSKSNGTQNRGNGVAVAVKLIDENDFDHAGRLDFLDNVIDRSTGTIRGRAVLDNPNGLFTPGMFGRIRVPGSPPYEGLLLPDAAIGTEQTRKTVMTVNDDNTVVPKYVTLGQTTPDNLRIIKSGLGPNDRVVVNGLMRARPGQKVTPQKEGAPPQGAPAGAPGAGAPAEKK
ncbi:MAG: efflux RND transporter periplasmic adaptor subunit, partial [Pseudolabrys sp.]|nr:efflux RND transporter periplasmic adaptor subunit [Pseudolabrys sp.]